MAMYTSTNSRTFQNSSTTDIDVEVLPPIYVNEKNDDGVHRFQKVKEQTDAELTTNAESIDETFQNSSAPDLDVEVLPPVYITKEKDDSIYRFQKVKEQGNTKPATDVKFIDEASAKSVVAFITVGAPDLTYYYYRELNMPSQLLDADGGRIRMIMQHETDGYDQVRVIDLTIGTEYINNQFGARGRFRGRYGWTRQQGGGDYSWILGDGSRHNIANPWNWAWIVDWRWLQDGKEIGGNRIRLYSHPHVTTRFIFYDN